jgi:cbb3-type cytochrome oxidase cytochrome c subunit
VALAAVAALGRCLPALDSDATPSLAADASHGSAAAAIWDRGQELYRTEGCWYCHSREVRPIVTDVGLGPVSVPGDYAYDDAALVGITRLGPDLAHFGSRDDAGPTALGERLLDPTADRAWSVMPSYRYLSDDDLAALTAYVAGLE